MALMNSIHPQIICPHQKKKSQISKNPNHSISDGRNRASPPFPLCVPCLTISEALQVPMETILSPHSLSLSPLLSPKASSSKNLLPHSLQPRSKFVSFSKPISLTLKKPSPQSLRSSLPIPSNWFSHLQHGLAALAISLALNFSPLLAGGGNALASEFDVLSDGPPKESHLVDDAGVLSRVTKSDLKRLLSDLESRKNFHIDFVTVRKLTVSHKRDKQNPECPFSLL